MHKIVEYLIKQMEEYPSSINIFIDNCFTTEEEVCVESSLPLMVALFPKVEYWHEDGAIKIDLSLKERWELGKHVRKFIRLRRKMKREKEQEIIDSLKLN